jgi:spermidine synthase
MARPHRPSTASDSPSLSGEAAPGATATSTSPTALLGLKMLVFWAGAVLMGLEIAGSRVLAPHFGNSIFVWGSLIAIFLMAISVGNYLGGRLADERPSHLMLNSICVGVSLWIFALAIFAQGFCLLLVQSGFGEQSGPLVASMALFLVPSIGMGMVSPFAIRLATSSLANVGKISGSLYALSNVGSIAGTMVTTFLLIPFVGLTLVLKGLGVVLLVAALLTAPGIWRRQHGQRLVFIAVATAGLLALPEARHHELRIEEKVVIEVTTPYHNIAVVDDIVENVRMLQFDRRYYESIVDIKPPHVSYAQYTDYFHLALLLNPQPKRSLFIGAGGAVGPRSFHLHDPQMEIDVVDIDQKVLDLTTEYFFLPDDPHIHTIAKDGRIFVRDAKDPYDCLVLDAFTIGGRIPFHLVTQEFFEQCSERMTEDGIFVMNINSAIEGPTAGIFRSTYRTLDTVFPQRVYVFQKPGERGTHNPVVSTNVIFVATKSERRIMPRQWKALAAEYRSDSYIGATTLTRLVDDLLEDVPDVSTAPLFTDDYAPIETMPF